MNNTISYYNNHAADFVDNTVMVDIKEIQDRFLKYIPEKGSILDLGCGSGRDSKYFCEKGYKVTATDGSKELCALASEIAGIEVKCMLFSDLDEIEVYNGIWACSSILHLTKTELKDVFFKMLRALKDEGYIYTSFKYGNFEGWRGDRYFTDFTENDFKEFLEGIPGAEIQEMWITADARPGRGAEKWLNMILKKSE